jgi:hypothetical protein
MICLSRVCIVIIKVYSLSMLEPIDESRILESGDHSCDEVLS